MINFLTAQFVHNDEQRQMRSLAIAFIVLNVMTLLVSQWPHAPKTPTELVSLPMIQPVETPVLSEQDIAIYRAAFEAAQTGDDETVDLALSDAENPLLIGHVLAERYLSDDYISSSEELNLWLQNFYDHPQAKDIAALAQRKGVKDAHLYAVAPAPLKGDGYSEHLGATSLPKHWYLGISAWKEQDYNRASKHFVKATSNKTLNRWHQAAAHFWAGRAYSKLDESALAYKHFDVAAEHDDTLYGMLASQRLGNRLQIQAASPFVSASSDEIPAYQRAKALTLVNQTALAAAELRQLFAQLSEERRPELLAMAGELGLANLQIRLRKLDGLHKDEQLFANYPIPSWLVGASKTLDPALSLSVALQESAFRSGVKSHAGAQGVMQVIPQTAAYVVKNPRFASLNQAIAADYSSADLLDPVTNVKIGSSYLNILRNKPYIADSLIHMLAGYNAGPGNVAAWSKAGSHIKDPLLYMESIPFAETRNYVVQTLTHYVIYQTLLGQQEAVTYALNNGQFPLYYYEG